MALRWPRMQMLSGTLLFTLDIFMNKDIDSDSHKVEHLRKYKLTSKVLESLEQHVGVGVPSRLPQQTLFSYCGKVDGHYPECRRLRGAEAFMKKFKRVTKNWNKVINP